MGNRMPLASLRYRKLGQAIESSNYAVVEEMGGVENVIEQARLLGRNVIEYTMDGYEYRGEMHEGMKHGYGILRFPDRSTYEGEWYGDTMEGRGRLVLPSGAVYEGFFRHGAAHGFGSHSAPNGIKIEGEWRFGALDGLGIVTLSDGLKVKCMMRNGAVDNNGSIVFPNGDQYNGELQGKVMNGTGQYLFARTDNDQLVCTFNMGVPDGPGRRLIGSQWYDVDYVDGVCVQMIPLGDPSGGGMNTGGTEGEPSQPTYANP